MNHSPQSQHETHLPPGPKGSWRPTLKLIRNPRAAMESWVNQYGDPFFLRALNGPVVVTGREDLIRIIHAQDPDIYEPFATHTTGELLGTGSMLILYGNRHRRERRMMTPMFQGERMKAYGTSMQTTAIERLNRYSKDETFSAVDLMTDISLEVIIQAIFGGDDRELAEQMFIASKKLVSRANPLLFFSRRSHFSCFGFSPWDRWRSAKAELVGLLDRAIDRRQKSDQPKEDILAMLLHARYEDGQPRAYPKRGHSPPKGLTPFRIDSMSREDLHAELLTFLFAGHETTALSMAWAIYHIHRDPNVCRLLREELDSLPDDAPDRLASAPYLKAVIQETLRINPIVTETLRKLREPLQFGDYRLPAGMAIAPATVLAHYNPCVYPDPDTFRPERFLERSYSPFEYMPFGGGHRRCIGAAFASYEMAMVLGNLIRHYDFELVDKTPVVPKRRSVTMGPSTSIPVRVKGR